MGANRLLRRTTYACAVAHVFDRGALLTGQGDFVDPETCRTSLETLRVQDATVLLVEQNP